MVATILDHNNKELYKQGQQQQQREWQKNDRFIIIGITTTLNVHHAFFLQTWNFLISCAHSMELVNTTQKISFPKLRYGAFRFSPPF